MNYEYRITFLSKDGEQTTMPASNRSCANMLVLIAQMSGLRVLTAYENGKLMPPYEWSHLTSDADLLKRKFAAIHGTAFDGRIMAEDFL